MSDFLLSGKGELPVRRMACMLLALLVILCLTMGVSAATGVSNLSGFATVNADGGCHISMTVTLHLEQAMDKLYFPIPGEATAVTLNGSRVSAPRSEGVRRVNLSRLVRNVVGDITANLQYSLYDVIATTQAGTLEMQLPLLSGFEYPIEKLEFCVTMPDAVEVLPGFVSGYHEARIEEDLTYSVSGATITGSSVRALKDHETLTMTLAVTEDMFPRTLTHTQDYQWALTAMAICAAAALLYWCIAMWNPPGLARTQPEPPEGHSAGNLGCIMAHTGLDLTMMVMSWAQLGYVLIHVKGRRVILHRRMEMGNERSETEVRWFRKVFGKRDRVDTTDARYAQLCRMAAKTSEGTAGLLRRFNGNPKIFRGIAGLIGLFGGMSIAVAMADGAALQGFLLVLFGALGAVSGWYIQLFGAGFFLRSARLLKLSLGLCGMWLLLGLLSGATNAALYMELALLAAGLLLAWGGRRTPLGRLTQMQTRGFARYLQTVSTTELLRIRRNDPDYFFRLAPYALALGREKTFAKRFGQLRLDRCGYLTTGMDGHMTVLQWAALMRKAVTLMDDRAHRLPLEKMIRMIRSITRG